MSGNYCEDLPLWSHQAAQQPAMDGSSYDPMMDGARLGNQFKEVWAAMKSASDFLSLAEIEEICGHPQSSISARLRDFRKAKFGSHTVLRRRRKNGGSGTWEYRLNPKTK